MRALIAGVALVVGMAVYAALPAAADEKAGPKAAGSMAERVQALHLTDEQEAKIADIRKEYRPRVQAAAKELAALVKEEVGKVRAVLTPEQKAKLAAMKEERRERRVEGLAQRIANLEELDLTDAEMARIAAIRNEFRPRIVKALEGLKGTLTAEQRKAREEGLEAGKSRREVIASLKLTNEQKEKVEAVGRAVAALVREELERVRDVLTEGQREKLREIREERLERVCDRMAHRIANLRDLNLTDDQKSQIEAIRMKYRPRIHEAGNKLRAAAREEVEQIAAVLRK